jgi:UPF0755 protein
MSESKLFLRLFLYVFGPLCAATVTFLLLNRFFISPVDPSDQQKRLLLVEPELSFEQIGEKLHEVGLVRNAQAMPIILELKGMQQAVRPGEYALSASMTPKEIADVLMSGKVEKRNMQVQTGDSIWTVSEKLNKAEIITDVVAAKAFTDPTLLAKAGVSGPSFEGYLGIGFYEFQKPITAEQIVWKMLEVGDQAWRPEFRAQATKLKLSKHSVLTLASILYAESPAPDFYKGLSSVYRNRLAKGLPLESMKALQYGLRDQQGEIPADVQDIESPYNTFKNFGLPPGPINTPSIESIEATLFAEDSEFMYVLVVGGKVEFFRDQQSYDIAKQRYMLK